MLCQCPHCQQVQRYSPRGPTLKRKYCSNPDCTTDSGKPRKFTVKPYFLSKKKGSAAFNAVNLGKKGEELVAKISQKGGPVAIKDLLGGEGTNSAKYHRIYRLIGKLRKLGIIKRHDRVAYGERYVLTNKQNPTDGRKRIHNVFLKAPIISVPANLPLYATEINPKNNTLTFKREDWEFSMQLFTKNNFPSFGRFHFVPNVYCDSVRLALNVILKRFIAFLDMLKKTIGLDFKREEDYYSPGIEFSGKIHVGIPVYNDRLDDFAEDFYIRLEDGDFVAEWDKSPDDFSEVEFRMTTIEEYLDAIDSM